jgi:serine/threonine protein kinase
MNWIDQDDETPDCVGLDMPELVGALEAYQDALRDGRTVDRTAFLNEHAAVADRLAVYLDALDMIQSVAGESSPDRDPDVDPSPLQAGDILGEFHILREIGRGGMGVVYEAEHLWLPERRVALKVLLGASSPDARALRRFRIETRAAACLNHPNIVPVFAAGCERDIPFYSMPLIPGRSLAEVLRMRRSDDRTALLSSTAPEPPWPTVVARLGLQAAEALDHAHSSGIIHRDIKPSNLLVDAGWKLWVTDFGLARLTRDDSAPTRTGDLVGTLRYMSPEQIRGEPCAGDPRTDIYSLGATLYEACTLRPVFEASDPSALVHHILNDTPPTPRTIASTIPKDLETIILKAMDKLPSARYATARDLADDLRRFLEDRPIRARRPNFVERSLRWSKRHRALIATAIAGIVVSMAFGTITLWQAKRQVEANLRQVSDARNQVWQAKRQVEANLRQVTDARNQEHYAIEGLFGINDMITVPLLHEATVAGMWDEERRLQSYRQLIGFYDRIVKTYAPDGYQLEVVAKAARRAGALRMSIGDPRGRDNYARAIDVYEAISAKKPRFIWYRTGLISTLREYAGHLERLGDRPAASARHRRAFEVAEGLLADKDTRLPCFRKGAIPEFQALLERLSDGPDASAADRTLADRMKTWLAENP